MLQAGIVPHCLLALGRAVAMKILAYLFLSILALVTLATASVPSSADDWRYRGDDIRNFHRHDLDAWRHGRWHHERHNGVFGWWWFGGGLWYYYPAPIYPYPDPYVPPYATLPPPSDAPPANWYYCDNPRGYYPYVPRCYGYWHKVPAVR